MVKLLEKVIVKKLTNPSGDTSALEQKIDRLVYELHGLTEEEVKVVEGDSGSK